MVDQSLLGISTDPDLRMKFLKVMDSDEETQLFRTPKFPLFANNHVAGLFTLAIERLCPQD